MIERRELQKIESMPKMEGEMAYSIGTHLVVKRSNKVANALAFDLNRNLDTIDATTIFAYTRQFFKNTEADFQLLAVLLSQDDEFIDINEIFGISVFPDAVGRRFGFKSEIYSTNERLIGKFLEQTSKEALLGNNHGTKTLRRFSINREDFIQKYSVA